MVSGQAGSQLQGDMDAVQGFIEFSQMLKGGGLTAV
jgi:hypothetical protein